MLGFSLYAALLPMLQQQWALSNAEAGYVGGMALGGYMLAVPWLSALTDRVDARHVYAVSAACSALGGVLFAVLADGVWTAALAQTLIGAGMAGTYMPGLRVLTLSLTQPGVGRQRAGASPQVVSRAVAFYTASFGVGMALSLLWAQWWSDAFGWRAAFASAIVGPLLAGSLVLWRFAPQPPSSGDADAGSLLGVRRVWGNRAARAYILGYAAHSWELFGSRTWMVAFLSFASTVSANSGAPWPVTAVAIAALGQLVMPPSSILGNELSIRYGRWPVIRFAMAVSGALSCALGFLTDVSWIWLTILVCVHFLLLNADSGAMTAGVLQVAAGRYAGRTLALYSMLGFAAGFVAPFMFGLVLDFAGGHMQAQAWGWAYFTLGVVVLLASTLLRSR